MVAGLCALLRRRRDENGASATEYGLLAFGIACLITVVVLAFGGVVKDTFAKPCASMASKASSTASCNG